MPRSLCSTQAAFAAGLSFSAGTPFAATMRPRSIGTRSSVALRRLLRHEGVEAAGIGRLDVDEKERRRLARAAPPSNCRRRLPSISITVTSSARPNPSDSTTRRCQRAGPVHVGDGEPQRGRARMRQPPRRPPSGARRSAAASTNTAPAARDEDQARCLRSIGERDRESPTSATHHQRRRDNIAPARPAGVLGDRIAKQRRHRHVMGAAERPQREGERGEEAVERARAPARPDAAPARPAAE